MVLVFWENCILMHYLECLLEWKAMLFYFELDRFIEGWMLVSLVMKTQVLNVTPHTQGSFLMFSLTYHRFILGPLRFVNQFSERSGRQRGGPCPSPLLFAWFTKAHSKTLVMLRGRWGNGQVSRLDCEFRVKKKWGLHVPKYHRSTEQDT